MKIFAHTSFIGNTGYNNHSRSFFCALNKYHTVKIRNLTIGSGWKGMSNTPHDDELYITDEMKDMLIQQSLYNRDGSRSDYPIYDHLDKYVPDIHIVLNDVNNVYFYDNYEGYKIAYNVWESTKYPDDFFQRLFYFDEVWVPTQWQFDSLVEQGYPKERISVVTEGVDTDVFKPQLKLKVLDKFRFLLFGRWEYRKSTAEIIKTFGEIFKGRDDVELVCSVENPFPFDGLKTTEERIIKHNVSYPNVKYINFLSREDYVDYLKNGHVYVSCSRSEGWGLPLIESMSCGTPSIYSDWGAQLQYAKNKGIPVKISYIRQANIEDRDVPGEYCEPDYEDLAIRMRLAYEHYGEYREESLFDAKLIHNEFNWDKVARDASKILEKRISKFIFVTAGDIGYMPVIEKLIQSINEFSDSEILVYGINCDVPFDYRHVIKRRINPPVHSEHDKWYWKQDACLESLKENYDKFVWIDGDVVINHNFDTIDKYFKDIDNYPLPDIHVQEEFWGEYEHNGRHESQLFNENLCRLLNVKKVNPYAHICMFIYNKNCGWWFEEIIKQYISVDLNDYKKYYLWNDEGIDNVLRWKYGFTKHLPLSNFDTSSYDGDDGFTNMALKHFYKFWNEDGPQNFNRIYGYQYIPKDKSNIIYFHGNKDSKISDKMIDFIRLKRDNNFYKSSYFYTEKYKLENLGSINGIEGGTLDIATKFGWKYAIYHEIYNLRDYYKFGEKSIFDGDIVVDLGGNMGLFNRWAYSEGAGKVISFEPDKRYFQLLLLNADPKSILFNAAVSDSIGTVKLTESDHFGGSHILGTTDNFGYDVRTYTLNYLFDAGLVDKIDFLKVDIEGAEKKAFDGISDENLMKIRTISMEYHHSHLNYDEELRDKFIKRLNNLGFKSYLLFMGTNNALQMIYFTR
jgi:FkbM family methyltransferase